MPAQPPIPQTSGPPIRRVNRRQLLCAGGLGFLGLNLAQLLEAETLARRAGAVQAPKSSIKSCILMFYYGGPLVLSQVCQRKLGFELRDWTLAS